MTLENVSKLAAMTSEFGEGEWSILKEEEIEIQKHWLWKGHHNHQHAKELQDHFPMKKQNQEEEIQEAEWKYPIHHLTTI